MKTVYVETNREDPQRIIVIPDDKSQSFFIKPAPVSGVPSDDKMHEITSAEAEAIPYALRTIDYSGGIYRGLKIMRDEIMLPSLAALTAELEAEKARRKEADKAVYETMQENIALSEGRDRMDAELDIAHECITELYNIESAVPIIKKHLDRIKKLTTKTK